MDRPITLRNVHVRAILDRRKTQHRVLVKPPGYAVGDRLWVREALTCSGALIQYAADHKTTHTLWPADWKQDPRPSLHMPRNLSRITLHVTDVRVQRLQSITEDDAKAEGVYEHIPGWFSGGEIDGAHRAGTTPRAAFALLWDSQQWADNPFVTAISFRPELRNIDAVNSGKPNPECTRPPCHSDRRERPISTDTSER